MELRPYEELTERLSREVLELRNSRRVREASLRTEPISWEEHCVFVESLDENRKYWAIVEGERLLGLLNVTGLEGAVPRWGIALIEGVSPRVAFAAAGWLLDPLLRRYGAVESLVKRGNLAARRFNERLGAELVEEGEVQRLRLSQMTPETEKISRLQAERIESPKMW